MIQKFARKIIHIDMDAFFAAVEQRDHPEWQGKPLVVGSDAQRGVIAAASYEARKYGVHSAMPSITAKRKCPDLIFAPHRFGVYKEVSQQIMAIFKKYTDLIEPLSLDEAFLDITENRMNHHSARETAMAIKAEIKNSTQLTASAGVSFNKFLAKIASDINKPNGITIITPEKAPNFVAQLPIEKFFGVGKKTAEKMHKNNIKNGADLLQWNEKELVAKFGKSGKHFFNMARLEDYRPVKPNRIRKSIGAERTFSDDITSLGLLNMKIKQIAQKIEAPLKKKNAKGRTITIKIKYNDFEQKTRSKTLENRTNSLPKIIEIAKELLAFSPIEKPVRLLGVSISNFEEKSLDKEKSSNTVQQLNLDF